MTNYFDWGDNDIVWSNNSYTWNAVYEVIAEVSSTTNETTNRGVGFVDIRRKHHQKKQNVKTSNKEEDKKYIKILCIINDEKFEDKKYVNQKLKIKSFDEELIIKEIKKVNISENDVQYEMIDLIQEKELIFQLENKKIDGDNIKIEVKNIEIR